MAAIVHIYLPTETQSTTGTEWIRALSIPRNDIERLTLRPLKWLRFATFTVCGAKGDLSATQGGEIVDYQNVSFEDLADNYYYTPDGVYHLVDYQVFNDQCTSSAVTERSRHFRRAICNRDGSCVITRFPSICDAAHIIPRSKGNKYITAVVRDRSSLYESLPSSLQGEVDINCIENGMLLRKDLHALFGTATIVFLKTPNFAMVPADIPRIEQGPIPDNRTTLQYMVPPTACDVVEIVSPRDVQADWSRDALSSPPSILLDFMYGAAVVKHWKCDHLYGMLEKWFKDDFSEALTEHRSPPAPEDDEPKFDSDDLDDTEYEPSTSTSDPDMSAGLVEALDDLRLLSMLLKGTTPQSMAAEQDKRDKEEELRSQQHSSEKVRQWLSLDASTRPL